MTVFSVYYDQIAKHLNPHRFFDPRHFLTLVPKFYGPTPSTPKVLLPKSKSFRPTLPTHPTLKFDPRQPRIHAQTLPTSPKNPHYSHYLADFLIKSK